MGISLWGNIQKVEDHDDGTITVYGIASTEAVDSAGEIVRADALRAAIPDYMKDFPAIREMHRADLAAGHALAMEVDADNVTRIEALITDPTSILKIRKSTLRGFSIGGKVTSRDPDNRKIITGVTLQEVSIVDRPACPDAKLTFFRADGLVDDSDGDEPEIPDPEAAEEVTKRAFDAKQRKKDAKSGVAMKDGSFPVADKEDLENAIRLAGKAKNPAAARAHIKRRAAALGLESMIPETWKDGAKKADVTESPMPKKTVAAEPVAEEAVADVAVEKTAEAAPINPTKLVDVLNDAQAAMDAAVGAAPAGKKITPPELPGNGPETATEVKNPEEAGQATPAPINATETPAVQGASAKADDAEAISDEAPEAVDGVEKADEEDPIAAAHAAADNAMKAATAVLARLAKQEGSNISPVLAAGAELRKGLSTAAQLGYLLCELSYILSSSKFEEEMEGDNSPVPAKLRTALDSLAAAYKAMSDEELQELLDTADKTMGGQITLAAAGGDLAKALEGVVDAGALSKAADATSSDELSKASGRISVLESERETLLKTVGALTTTMNDLANKVQAIEDAPLPAKTIAIPAGIEVVSKADDTVGRAAAAEAASQPSVDDVHKFLGSMSKEDRDLLVLKASLSPINARVFTR